MNIDFSYITAHLLLSPDDVDPLVLEASASALMDESRTVSLLLRMKELYEADDYLLPASVIGMSLFNVIVAQLIAQAKYGKELNMSLDNIHLQVKLSGTFPVIYIKIDDCALQRAQPITELVHQLDQPIKMIAKAASVKPSLIYNQFGARIAQITESFLQYEKEKTVQATYNSLLNQLKNDEFFEKNPFQYEPKYIDSPYELGKKMMIRSACCMFYRKKDGKKCFNCPTLSEHIRNEMRDEILTSPKR
ncbi:hypothetical protein IEO70_01235 [Bacillus sp. AGMB 02131]|uniref:Ferric siderophore reductase C-terminal domain-containing protein n=1 Tax=Peribacillus faecalis TaxID=2772559 RepID=A0A927HA26_9BACI|nr:hypothetical protein [Peribacillus faecalis]MBD3107001.1 hypothetical protein [Peribacillus faecalis]